MIFIAIKPAGFQQFDTVEGAQQWVEDTVATQCMAGFAIAEVVLVHEAAYHWVDPRQRDDSQSAKLKRFWEMLRDSGLENGLEPEVEEALAKRKFDAEVEGYNEISDFNPEEPVPHFWSSSDLDLLEEFCRRGTHLNWICGFFDLEQQEVTRQMKKMGLNRG